MSARSITRVLAATLLFSAACGRADIGPLDSWLGLETVYNTEETNGNALNAALANAALANAALANAALANAALANAALANAALANAALANSATFTGVSFSGVTVSSAAVRNISFNGGLFSGVRESDSSQVSGIAFKNAIMKGKLSNNASMDMRIDDIVHDSYYNVDWYYVSMSIDNGYSWWPLCKNGVGALPLANRWSASNSKITDPSLFTFACDQAALAKCAKWGYDPQKTKREKLDASNEKYQSLDDWHQACTRLVTADYCGDGVSHTRTGTPIDIYDNLNIQSRDGSLRATEADWGADGAHCIRQTRWVNSTGYGNDLAYVTAHCPDRLAINNPVSCGGDPNHGSADVTNYPTSRGYNVDTSFRNLLRNDSYGFLP